MEQTIIADWLIIIAEISAVTVGYIGIFVILYGAIRNAAHFVRCSISHKKHLPEIRIDLGKHLALGLEFLIGKDVILSIVEPNWEDLGKLAILVIIRTVVGIVLSWELKEAKEELDIQREHDRLEAKKVTRK